MNKTSRILFYYPASNSDGYPEPPLGLGYLMTVAKKAQFEYRFYDCDHHSKFGSLEKILGDFKPDVIAMSFMTPQFHLAARAVERFKKQFPGCLIISGGPHPTALPQDTLRQIPDIDVICQGEGEKTFEEFLKFLKGEIPLDSIAGLVYKQDGHICFSPARDHMKEEELDRYSVDWPALMGYGPYIQKLSYQSQPVPVFPVITARGCPFHCTFCDDGNIWGRKVRMRSVQNVIHEIRYLIEHYQAKYFNILDDTFTLKKDRVREFCEQARPLGIRFRITARIKSVDKDMLFLLKQAGCDLVAYGVESGDDTVLSVMKKGQTVEDIKKAMALTREAGLLSYALCMVGNIGEDMKAVKKTADLLKETKPDLAGCAIMMPYPGSENYRTCKQNGWILHENWENWVPSVLKTKTFQAVSRTDKMSAADMLKAYYFLNRTILFLRFRYKYGDWFFLNLKFYTQEVLSRVKTVGFMAFFRHAIKLLRRDQRLSFKKDGDSDTAKSVPFVQQSRP